MTITSLEDLAILVETTDVECKAAQGKSGKGEISESIWATYSAMTNTNGGHITRGAKYTLPGKSYRAFTELSEDSSSPDLAMNSPDLAKIVSEKLAKWNYTKMPGKLDANKMQELIVILCQEQWLSLSELSTLLDRDSKALQDQYLTPMLAAGRIRLKFEDTLNHPRQAYGSMQSLKEHAP